MKAASVSELKKELQHLSQAEIINICMRLARYKKENKELLTYLLQEAGDEEAYIQSIKEMLDEEFSQVNPSNAYQAKKTLRRIVRINSRYIKYSGIKETEAELILYFCKKLRELSIYRRQRTAFAVIYDRQLAKLQKTVSALHEDLQFDYHNEISCL